MCGVYQLNSMPELIRNLFPKEYAWQLRDDEFVPSARIGPSAKKPGSASNHRLVVRRQGSGAEFASIRWRFETRWMRDKGVSVPINAKSETMFTNGLFKYAARERRCLVIVDGFYEPKGPKLPRGQRREQYRFAYNDNRPFALGGLWTTYRADDDQFDGFVICTTAPNEQVAPIHARMPVILDSEAAWTAWLTGSQSDVQGLCQPESKPHFAAVAMSS